MTRPELVLPDVSAGFWLLTKIQYLSSAEFKAKMSHVVRDLAGSVDGVPPRCVCYMQDSEKALNNLDSPDFAEWVYDLYRGRWVNTERNHKSFSVSYVSQENVRCVMGYIVDLTVVLDDIFRIAAGHVSSDSVHMAMDRHVSSGRRDRIHGDITSFVTEVFAIRSVPKRDLTLEKTIDLIRRYCVPPSPRG
jgi:hypothetical protein